MDIFIIFLLLFLILIPLAYLIDKRFVKNRRKHTENFLLNSTDFSLTEKVVSIDGNFGLAFDDESQKVRFIDNQNGEILVRTLSYRDLISSEIFQDGETITSSVRSGDIGNALVGGFLFGGAGAVVGSLSGKTKSLNTEIVHKISLRLIVNDTKNPLFEIDFLNSQTKKKDSHYQEAMQKARHWHGLIEVLIKRADMEDKESEKNNVSQNSSNSIADELKKLAELRDSGVLSESEFQQQKEKLLG